MTCSVVWSAKAPRIKDGPRIPRTLAGLSSGNTQRSHNMRQSQAGRRERRARDRGMSHRGAMPTFAGSPAGVQPAKSKAA